MTDRVVVTNDETSYIVESVGEVGPQGEHRITVISTGSNWIRIG